MSKQHKSATGTDPQTRRNQHCLICLNNGWHDWELSEVGDVDCDEMESVSLECKVCSVVWYSDMPELLEEDMNEIRIKCGWCKECNVLKRTSKECECVIGDEEE